MALYVAIIILLSPDPDYRCYLKSAKEVLYYFARTFEINRQNISHNLHSILNLTDA